MTNQSRSALLDFLDYLSTKGLMNRTTAASRKAAVNKVLGILDDAEASDVSKLDIDDVMNRFMNLSGSNYTPDSLSTYKSRLRSAIDDFLRYQKNPLNFKPSQSPANGARRTEQREKPATQSPSRNEASQRIMVDAPPAAVNIVPIPIRPDLTIMIQGLPFDLTGSEANKIANVIKAMASN